MNSHISTNLNVGEVFLKNLFVIISLVVLTSCAQMKQDWIDSNCNVESAESSGMNAAQAEEPSNPNQYSMCPASERSTIRSAYLKGYKQNRPNRLVNKLTDLAGLNTYQCTLDVFTQSYTSTKKNRGVARADVIKQCMAKNHKMHCHNISCKKL